MTDHNPNRPVGGLPPERDRLGGGSIPPEHRPGPPRDDRGNSAMALIVGALAVALIIGAFFWFAGDTQDTATLGDPATTQEDTLSTEPVPDDDAVTGTTEQETNVTVEPDTATTEPDTATETDTTTTMADEPAAEEEVIDETQQGATEEPADGEVIDQTQQN